MDDRFDVIFRGDIAPGATIAGVREELQALFGLDTEQVNRLFTGRKNVDRATADKFRQLMAKAGALVELRSARADVAAAATEEPTPAAPTATSVLAGSRDAATPPLQSTDMSLAPVGADVLKPEEKAAVEPVQVQTEHLSVEAPGADVLRPGERRRITDRDVDTSHLHLARPD